MNWSAPTIECLFTLADVNTMAAELLGDTEFHGDDPHYRAAVWILFAIAIKPDAILCSYFTNYRRQECAWFGIVARRYGLVKRGRFPVERYERDESAVQFLLDTMLLAGSVSVRRKRNADFTHWRYSL